MVLSATRATTLRRRAGAALCAALLLSVIAGTQAPAGAQQSDLEFQILSQATSDPLAIDVAPDGRVIWTQRDGTVWVLTPEGVQVRAVQLPVSANACPTCIEQDEGHTTYHGNPNPGVVAGLEEGGLHGLLVADDFAETGRVYLYRSLPGTRNPGPDTRFTSDGAPIPPTFGLFRLSTFVLSDLNLIDPASEQVILDVPVEWDHCCHYGGSLNYLPDGTILLSTGDDVHFSASNGYGPRDHRNIWHNGELSSANPADRRGKILRLMPDGSVPDGSQPGIAPNPFIRHEGYNPYIADSSGTPDDGWIEFDPYVYAMGFKQPWRGTVHPSGTLYVDDVGPDATLDDPVRGPRGFEEINAVPLGGGTHHGWPRCMADNRPYIDVNWETGEIGGELDCSATAPVSRPLEGAPVPTPRQGMAGATFFYGRQAEPQYPAIGTGGLTAEPTAVYPADNDGPLRFPERFNDQLIVLEWSRNRIFTIPTNPDGSLVIDGSKMEQIRPATTNVAVGGVSGAPVTQAASLQKPIDGAIGPDGALYLLEYGPLLYDNPYSRVSRITCAGCSAADPAPDYGASPPSAPNAPAPLTAAASIPPWAVAIVVALGMTAVVRRRRGVA